MADQLLARSQLDRAIDPEGEALLADHDLGVTAAVEILADAQGDFVGDSRSQSLANVDMLAGDLDLHALSTRLSKLGVKRR
jgi:hypothetical protein